MSYIYIYMVCADRHFWLLLHGGGCALMLPISMGCPFFVVCLVYPMLPITMGCPFFVVCLVYPMLPISMGCPFFVVCLVYPMLPISMGCPFLPIEMDNIGYTRHTTKNGQPIEIGNIGYTRHTTKNGQPIEIGNIGYNIVRGKNLVTVSRYRSATSYKNVISSCDRLWLFRWSVNSWRVRAVALTLQRFKPINLIL
jgi:hypothetical protein